MCRCLHDPAINIPHLRENGSFCFARDSELTPTVAEPSDAASSVEQLLEGSHSDQEPLLAPDLDSEPEQHSDYEDEAPLKPANRRAGRKRKRSTEQ